MGNTIDESGELENYTDNDDVYEIDNEDQINEMISNEQMERLATLIVDKMLNAPSLKKVLAKQNDSRSGDRDRHLRSFAYNFKIQDLIDTERGPLELGSKAKFAEGYLNVVLIIYSELQEELGLSFFKEDKVRSGEDDRKLGLNIRRIQAGGCCNLLYRIEKFLVVLAFNSTPAYIFDNESEENLDRESFGQVKSRITALGFEFLYFVKYLDVIRQFNAGKYLSKNIQLFLNFIENYHNNVNRNMYLGQNFLRKTIHFSLLNELNYIFTSLKKVMIEGSFQLESSHSLIRYVGYIPEDRIYNGQSNANFKSVVIKYAKKIESVKKYFQAYKLNNITLYRIRIWLDLGGEKQVTLTDFQTFFTELNKKASKPEVGFKGYLNFFYIWNIKEDQWFQDIVLIMDSETLLNIGNLSSKGSIRSITQEFEAYANELLNHKADTIFKDQQIPKLKIDSIPLMHYLNLPSQFLMEIKDRDAWRIFENSILPFFVYHEMLGLNLDEEIRGRFSHGRKKIE